MKHLISLKEQSAKDIAHILSIAAQLKTMRAKGKLMSYLAGKTLIMLFQKSSTRTRLSFEAGMTELGGHAIFLDARTTQFGLTDFRDEIRAVMRFGSILMFRALRASDVEFAASCNQIPVIDACSEKYHPAQALGDLLTMSEYSGGIKKIKKVAWLGIENNVSNTLKLICAKVGIEIAIIAPEKDEESIDEKLNAMSDATGKVTYTRDLKKGLQGADYVHTDTWVNMEFFENGKVKTSFKKEYERRKKVFLPYQLNAALIEKYAPRARIMHCMPFHIGYEISRDAVEHPSSIVFDQAENRMHIQKAIMLWLLGITP